MTKMIYRGFEHDSINVKLSKRQHDMIYRGVRHDGLAAPQTTVRTDVPLIYRGFWHGASDVAVTAETAPCEERFA